jgi:hypothetical protein
MALLNTWASQQDQATLSPLSRLLNNYIQKGDAPLAYLMRGDAQGLLKDLNTPKPVNTTQDMTDLALNLVGSINPIGNVTKGLLGQTENKLLTDIEKRKPFNSFFTDYQDKLMPNSLPNTGNTFESENYMKFVNDNKPMLEEYITSMKDKINSYSGLTEKQKAKKINDSMRDARVDVINTWKYLTEKNEILKNIPTEPTNQGLLK